MALKENLTRFIQAIKENPNQEIEEIQELVIDTIEDEIRASSGQFITLCHTLTEALVKTNRSVSGIYFMKVAISKLQNHRNQLTPIHSDLCLLCLESNCLNPALELLELDYTEIRIEDKEEDVKHVQSFYYRGGLIYAAVKNFERASYYFEVVLTIPATTMTQIMQETYKKFVLLNLLMNGKLPDQLLPKYAPMCVMRQRKLASTYFKLAQEYSSLNYDKIQQLVNANLAVYERDGNMRLIKQCLKQVHKRNIKRLTKTFLTLPLRDVASYVGLPSQEEAESYIMNMIDDGEISAVIDQKNGMVVFKENPENYDTVAVFQKLQEDMSISTNLINTLKKIDTEATVLFEQRQISRMASDM